MIEKDYVMRLIKEIVRTLIKLLFGIDTEVAEERLAEDTEGRDTLKVLYEMIDNGKICEAEDMLYEIMEDKSERNLMIAALVYSYMNDKSDDFLAEHNFSRGEIESGIRRMAEECGVYGVSDIFVEQS